jgi:hypothetical protein
MGTQSKTAKQRALRAMDSQDTQKLACPLVVF